MPNVVSLDPSNRQGSYQTGSYVVPATASGTLTITATMATAEYEDAANRLALRLYALDGEGVWRVVVGMTWVGGRSETPWGVVNPPPGVATALEPLRGRSIRGEVDVPIRMRVGCTVSVE